MKSKKIVAMFVALVAIMAVATSGLAATTTYNYQEDGYVNVNVKVKADAGKEVTYLVTSGATILYIDQQTADAQSGMVEFEYKIKDSNMPKTYSGIVANFGTNGTTVTTSDAADATLAFGPVTFNEGNFEVTYPAGVDITKLGTGDAVQVTVAPKANFTITGITVNGNTLSDVQPTGKTFEVKKGDSVEVTTVAQEIEPDINVVTPSGDFKPGVEGDEEAPSSAVEFGTITDGGKDYKVAATTKIIQVSGKPHEIGVKYNGKTYKADPDSNDGYVDGNYYAVRIVINGEVAPSVIPYVIAKNGDQPVEKN